MKKYLEYRFPRIIYGIRKIKRQIHNNKMKSMSIQEKMKTDAELYYKKTGDKLDWTNLQTYTEKMQWEKLFDNDPRKTLLADKYRVRDWVSEKIGEQYLIPLIGVWTDAKDIDFEKLPLSFVLKTNCGSGDVVIIKDRSELSGNDILRIKSRLNFYLHYDCGCNSFEFHYSKIPPRIICEDLLVFPGADVPDYKFLCFDGQPYFCWVDIGRYHNHKRNVYDLKWNLQPWNQKDYGNSEELIEKPKNFDKMIELVSILSQGFSHVRVDLYNIEGKIYFGEMTFTNGSGFEKIYPREADLMLGELWGLDTSTIPL